MLKLVLGWFWCQGFANPQQWRWLKVEDEPWPFFFYLLVRFAWYKRENLSVYILSALGVFPSPCQLALLYWCFPYAGRYNIVFPSGGVNNSIALLNDCAHSFIHSLCPFGHVSSEAKMVPIIFEGAVSSATGMAVFYFLFFDKLLSHWFLISSWGNNIPFGDNNPLFAH